MSVGIVAGVLGVAQGVRHALEPDHLAAVSTLASEQPNARAGLRLGASWGVGHTLSLVVVGGSLSLLQTRLPARAAASFELGVALMLILLGLRAVVRSLGEAGLGPAHLHAHGGALHAHTAPHQHVHAGRFTFSTRPLLIGLVHGLAGSGALSALVIAELPTAAQRVSYITLFGLGSVVGMALLSAAVGMPLARLQRAPLWAGRLLRVVGVLSTGLGVWWGLQSVQGVLG